jgi:hypothetical protein
MSFFPFQVMVESPEALRKRPFAEDVGQVIGGRSWQEGHFLPFGFHGEACIVLVRICGEEGMGLLDGGDARQSHVDDEPVLQGTPEAFYPPFRLC